MKVYLGADHRGFNLKESLKFKLVENNLEVLDCGNTTLDPNDDYVDFASKVAKAVSEDETSRGILICGSGAGVDIVANKFKGIRSALAFDLNRVKQSREHEDANVLSLPSDVIDKDLAWRMAQTFLETPFSNEQRHLRRINKIKDLESSR